MPIICQFYGIMIRMYFADHSPPHFHAVYGDEEIVVGIHPIRILAGEASMRVRSMVMEWAAIHQDELLANWESARRAQPLTRIAPLE